jgi:hypothetical protein
LDDKNPSATSLRPETQDSSTGELRSDQIAALACCTNPPDRAELAAAKISRTEDVSCNQARVARALVTMKAVTALSCGRRDT